MTNPLEEDLQTGPVIPGSPDTRHRRLLALALIFPSKLGSEFVSKRSGRPETPWCQGEFVELKPLREQLVVDAGRDVPHAVVDSIWRPQGPVGFSHHESDRSLPGIDSPQLLSMATPCREDDPVSRSIGVPQPYIDYPMPVVVTVAIGPLAVGEPIPLHFECDFVTVGEAHTNVGAAGTVCQPHLVANLDDSGLTPRPVG